MVKITDDMTVKQLIDAGYRVKILSFGGDNTSLQDAYKIIKPMKKYGKIKINRGEEFQWLNVDSADDLLTIGSFYSVAKGGDK